MFTNSILLGVNIDHVATLRQARFTKYPEPIKAALLAEQAGADGITVHLREDRRHIQERDVKLLKEIIATRLNLEMAATQAMLEFACEIKPTFVCLVPEKREELTTEGGLNVAQNFKNIQHVCHELKAHGITVSLFIDADKEQIDAAKACDAPYIEIHTGQYADAKTFGEHKQELEKIRSAAEYAHGLGIHVNAGHGLHYENVTEIAAIPEIVELNIGHAIIARAIFSGIELAVADMKDLMLNARG